MEVKDEISVVGSHRLLEYDAPDAFPILDVATLNEDAARVTLVGYLDVESERSSRLAHTLVVDLSQDFVAEIEMIA
jgi:hypothetical protein